MVGTERVPPPPCLRDCAEVQSTSCQGGKEEAWVAARAFCVWAVTQSALRACPSPTAESRRTQTLRARTITTAHPVRSSPLVSSAGRPVYRSTGTPACTLWCAAGNCLRRREIVARRDSTAGTPEYRSAGRAVDRYAGKPVLPRSLESAKPTKSRSRRRSLAMSRPRSLALGSRADETRRGSSRVPKRSSTG